jgi:large subunit ribosomal protein L2
MSAKDIKIKTYKPTSAGVRHKTGLVTSNLLAKKRPEKSLTEPLRKKAGRSRGKITVRHRGGGHKRQYRIIDFKRTKRDVSAQVVAIEYDPNRSAHLALVEYEDGERRYILYVDGLKVGDAIVAAEKVSVNPGNAAPLKNLPVGTVIHNVELTPGKGGQIIRSAGTSATLMARDRGLAQLKMPSGEIRFVSENCWATVGVVGNPGHNVIKIGKAGRKRHMGFRPTVRGTAMPAGEHPHGGGEGRTGTGRPSKTVYGKPAHGKKTRKPNRKSNRLIVQGRKKRRRK